MPKLPHINQMKFGIIDANYMNTLARSSDEFEEMKPELSEMISDKKWTEQNFLVELTGYDGIAINSSTSHPNMTIAWKYNWKRVELNALPRDTHFDDIVTEENYLGTVGINVSTSVMHQFLFQSEGGDVMAKQGYAYNLAEISNVKTFPIVFGIDVDSENYPDGYSPQPCPVGSIVRLQEMSDYEGNTHFVFDRQGVHDGTCE